MEAQQKGQQVEGLWLDSLSPKETLSKIGLKILVLGGYGTGKSYFARSFPEPIFLLDFDRGAIGYQGRKVYVPRVFSEHAPARSKLAKIERELDQVVKGTHPAGSFSTIVLDSLTTFTKLAMESALETRPAPDGIPVWNVHYPMVKVILDRIINSLLRFKGHSVIISHVEYERDELSGEIIVSPAVTGKLKAYVPALFDEVYFAEAITRQGKTEYILRLSPHGFKKARSRLRSIFPSIPELIPNSYDALASHLKSGTNR